MNNRASCSGEACFVLSRQEGFLSARLLGVCSWIFDYFIIYRALESAGTRAARARGLSGEGEVEGEAVGGGGGGV